MSKFKVGDKVWYEGKVFEIDAVDEILEGQFLYYFDNGYDYEGHEGIYLKPYKTPHQELLDLGWVVLNKANGVLTYLLNADGSLHPEIIELSLEGKRYYTTLRIIDLQLAKILVRYLEELWKK